MTCCEAAAALGLLEAEAAAALPLAPLAPAVPDDMREGPEPLDGLAMGEPVVEGS